MPRAEQPRMEELYSALGYNKNTPDFKALDNDAQEFFKNYISRGHVIPQGTSDMTEATLCASKFLTEEKRGYKYWPTTGASFGCSWPRGLIWPTDKTV